MQKNPTEQSCTLCRSTSPMINHVLQDGIDVKRIKGTRYIKLNKHGGLSKTSRLLNSMLSQVNCFRYTLPSYTTKARRWHWPSGHNPSSCQLGSQFGKNFTMSLFSIFSICRNVCVCLSLSLFTIYLCIYLCIYLLLCMYIYKYYIYV